MIHKVQNTYKKLPKTEIGRRSMGGRDEKKHNEQQEGPTLKSQKASLKVHFLNAKVMI